MQKQDMFTTAMHVANFDKHEKNKELYKRFIDKTIASQATNSAVESHQSTKSITSLHSTDVFDDLKKCISNCCSQLIKDYKISKEMNLAITSMWGEVSKHGQITPPYYHPKGFIQAAYFLDTPTNSGNLEVVQDLTDRNYFASIGVQDVNPLNSCHFMSLIPEGSIFFMPSHLTTSYSPNNDKADRYVVNCLLEATY